MGAGGVAAGVIGPMHWGGWMKMARKYKARRLCADPGGPADERPETVPSPVRPQRTFPTDIPVGLTGIFAGSRRPTLVS